MQHFWKQLPLSSAIRISLGIILGLSTALVGGQVRPALAATWYVSTAGSDSNDCTTAGAPCKTINAVLAKPGFVDNDIVRVTQGVMTGTGTEVVVISRSVQLLGGWNSSFITQFGTTTVDGENARNGIVVNAGATVTIGRFTVRRAPKGGFGIRNMGTAIIERTTISENATGLYAGGGGATTLQLSLVNSNTVGVLVASGTPTVTVRNTTVVYNGTGLQNGGAPLVLNNLTIAYNTLGGIDSISGTTLLQNSILSANNGNCWLTGGTVTSGGYNLLGASASTCLTALGTDIQSDDPGLAPLRSNGGATLTQALFPGSLAVNKGNPVAVGSAGGCESSDQRDVPRPQLGICDIGAYESNNVYLTYLPIVGK